MLRSETTYQCGNTKKGDISGVFNYYKLIIRLLVEVNCEVIVIKFMTSVITKLKYYEYFTKSSQYFLIFSPLLTFYF